MLRKDRIYLNYVHDLFDAICVAVRKDLQELCSTIRCRHCISLYNKHTYPENEPDNNQLQTHLYILLNRLFAVICFHQLILLTYVQCVTLSSVRHYKDVFDRCLDCTYVYWLL